jgi:hypothetical protein
MLAPRPTTGTEQGEVVMTTDLTIGLANQPGSLAAACEALGHAGVNIEAACGVVVADQTELHVLIADAERATRTLIDAGFVILGQRQVVVAAVENRPGGASRLLRRVTDAGVSLDLLYTTLDGRVVLGSADLPGLRAALA